MTFSELAFADSFLNKNHAILFVKPDFELMQVVCVFIFHHQSLTKCARDSELVTLRFTLRCWMFSSFSYAV